jgi:hypothetical protein
VKQRIAAMDQYVCADDTSRLDDARSRGYNAFSTVEVDTGTVPGTPPQRTLLVRCLGAVPEPLSVRVVGGVRADPAINPVRVLWSSAASRLGAAHAADPDAVTQADVDAFAGLPDPDRLLVVRTSSAGDFSTYRVEVVPPVPGDFDPRLAGLPFSFKVDCPDDLDCRVPQVCPPPRTAEPDLDYLNRDFAGLRRMLLDRLSIVLPQWTDRNVADVGVLLVELFAYLGDRLAYGQDAVSAEAYLGTARLRTSVTRHARLLDYRVHEGVAARCWLVMEAGPRGDGRVVPADREVRAADDAVVFHTLHPVTVRAARNAIDLYTWGARDCCLPRGGTRATLVGSAAELGLVAGDALVLEEVRSPDGDEDAADPTHRWAVRLAEDPEETVDPLTGMCLLEVRWHDEDALPFALCLRRFARGRCEPDVGSAVARGNVVLAEHGRLVGPEPVVPASVPEGGRYRPRLAEPGLAHAVPYRPDRARARPATEALAVAPADAVPQVRLEGGGSTWTARADLLASDRFAPHFTVEVEDDGRAALRFGDDVLGRQPVTGEAYAATFRRGGGRAGNCGRDVLTEFCEPLPGVSVRNPMPAAGGADPEPVEQARLLAPQAFRVQERAVTDADHAEIAQRDPRVQRAAATRRWTGSWYTEVVTVDPHRDSGLERLRPELTERLERVRMAGLDVAVTAPVYVPLDIVLTVCVEPGFLRGAVRRALVDRFSARDLPDGGRGFFHPDEFTFAQPVHLSRIVAAAMSVTGVAWLDTEVGKGKPNRFQRWGREPAGEREAGRIAMGRLEVARCDSDPNQPENGRIAFVMEGGVQP